MKGFPSELVIWRNIALAALAIAVIVALPSLARWWQGDPQQEPTKHIEREHLAP